MVLEGQSQRNLEYVGTGDACGEQGLIYSDIIETETNRHKALIP